MTIDDISRKGTTLGWTRDQALYLTDIIRNAVIVLASREPQPQSAIDDECNNLLACVGAVANVGFCSSDGASTQELEARAREG